MHAISDGLAALPSLDVISPKNGNLVHLKWYFSLFNVTFSFLHIYITHFSTVSWLWPFDRGLNISSMLCWSISLTGASPTGNISVPTKLTRKLSNI